MTLSIQDDELMLQAYCDGELDAATMAAFQRRLSADSTLRKGCDDVMALRRSLRNLPDEIMPPGLEAQVNGAIGASRASSHGGWRALAACALAGLIIGGVLTSVVERYQPQQDVASIVVASHIRSLLAPQPFDIASSDRHTVKPWFTTRVPVSPQVVDLSSSGFDLVGGRIDVVGQQPVATIVYRHAAHVVSLTILDRSQAIPDAMIAGYRVRSWRDGNMTYVAVSDLPAADLAAFERAFIAETNRL